jgi:hypothetical protein
MKDLMAGIDLHSNNIMTGLVDQEGKRVAQQKLPCELKGIQEFLAPYKDRHRRSIPRAVSLAHVGCGQPAETGAHRGADAGPLQAGSL